MNLNGNGSINQHRTEKEARPIVCRGVRGAITVSENDAEEILAAARELLQTIAEANQMHPDDISSVYFTTTPDLNAAYPALAARQLGWSDVALMCAHEMDVPGGMPRCLRILIHWNTPRSPREIAHVYLKDARALRPDRDRVPPVRPRQVSAMEAMIRVLEATL